MKGCEDDDQRKGKGKGQGVRLRHMAQRFHEQSEDRNLSFFLSRIGHHSPRYSREGQVTKASCKRSQRDGARPLFFCLFTH